MIETLPIHRAGVTPGPTPSGGFATLFGDKALTILPTGSPAQADFGVVFGNGVLTISQ